MSSASIETTLEKSLLEVAAALEAEDPVTAAPAVACAVRAVEEARKSGFRLHRQKIVVLQNIQERCDRAAKKLFIKLRESVIQTGNSRRAVDTYCDQ